MSNKVKQSETRTIKRSEITLASYNPRKISPEAKKKLKANLKANGIIGGLVWNEQTGNLVSGHQKTIIADEINKYDIEAGTNDYDLKVEVVNVDLKTEKEYNIFFNSKAVQGEFDYSLLANMVGDIDVVLAGLDDLDISMIELEVPDVEIYQVPEFNPQEEKKIAAEIESGEHDQILEKTPGEEKPQQDNSKTTTSGMTEAEKIAHVKNIKAIVKDGAVYEGEPYFTVSFDTFENKLMFLENIGVDDPTGRFFKGEEFSEIIEDYVDSHFDDDEDDEEETTTEAEIVSE